jgi:DNA invertase Pin-like site-specific DNA recombinase
MANNLEKIEKAFGYIRVSTAGQAKEGYSLDEQRDEITEYCKQMQWELLAIYEDAGISGADVDEDNLIVDRPGIQDLMADLKDSEVSYVVVLTTSRLWRSDLVKILIQREFKKHNVDVRAIDRPTYSIYNLSKDPSAFLINSMMEILDQYERLEIALKLRRGRNKKASLGGYAGGNTALGYQSKRGSKLLEIDNNKAATVQRLFEIKLSFPIWSLQQIADQLNKEGHRTKEGKLFQKTQVKRALDRVSLYTGTYKYSGIEVPGQHKSILIHERK